MSIPLMRFPCSGCGRTMTAAKTAAGRRGTCTQCGTRMAVPGPIPVAIPIRHARRVPDRPHWRLPILLASAAGLAALAVAVLALASGPADPDAGDVANVPPRTLVTPEPAASPATADERVANPAAAPAVSKADRSESEALRRLARQVEYQTRLQELRLELHRWVAGRDELVRAREEFQRQMLWETANGVSAKETAGGRLLIVLLGGGVTAAGSKEYDRKIDEADRRIADCRARIADVEREADAAK